MDVPKYATTENQAAKSRVKVSAVHVPMQRAAMTDAPRCDGQRTALRHPARNKDACREAHPLPHEGLPPHRTIAPKHPQESTRPPPAGSLRIQKTLIYNV